MSDDKKRTGGFIEQTFHPWGCGHARPDEPAEDEGAGPSKVATEAYRTGWESIFGKKGEVGSA